MKKKNNFLTYIPLISVVVMVIGFIASFARFTAKAEETSTKVVVIEEKVEKLQDETTEKIEEVKEKTDEEIKEIKEDKQELDKVVVEQSIKLQYIQQSIDKTNENLKEILQEVKKKK